MAAVVCAWVAVSLAHVLAPPILVALAWALLVREEWLSLVLGEWESQGQVGLSGPAEVLGPAEELGQAEASGEADGPAAGGLAGAVEAGGRGGEQVLASRWPPGGRTTVVTGTATILVFSGYPIGVG